MAREMKFLSEEAGYKSDDGWTMKRAGNPAHWHLYDDKGVTIGKDKYRFDLEGRHNLRLER